MRITPPDNWKKWGRKAAAVVCLVLGYLFLRRVLLVVVLALKILGHTDALDAWKGPVRRETVEHAGIPIDIYGAEHFSSSILIIHGVNPTGKDSSDLVRISEA